MRSLFVSLLFVLVAASLAPQEAGPDTQADARAVERRYITESDGWRLALAGFVLQGNADKYKEVEAAMRQFISVTASYFVYKRPGEESALKLYYRNLENIAKLDRLRELAEAMRRDYPEYTKDFLAKYEFAVEEFETFEKFEPVYERVLNRWRAEFEGAMQKRDVPALVGLREDMRIFQQGITVFVLLPGRSANKVPQLQKMENDLRHGIVMLRMYEQTTQDALNAERQTTG